MAAAGAGLAASGRVSAAETFFTRNNLPIGLQLYTVAAAATADLGGTLSKVANIGFRTVETAGYFGHTPAELRAALDKAGLKCTSAHIWTHAAPGEPTLNDDPGVLAEQGRVIGFDTIILPLFNVPARFALRPLPGENLNGMVARIAAAMTADDWKGAADFLNAKAAGLAKHGIKLGYHNHNVEFSPVGSETGLSILLKNTDPALVSFEMDVGWVVAGGVDPVALLDAFPDRFKAVHVKDVAATTTPNYAVQQDPAEVGSGIIPWKKVLPKTYHAGVRRFFVEQEPPFDRPPLEAVKISFDYLSGLKV